MGRRALVLAMLCLGCETGRPVWVVDRVEEGVAVLVEDSGEVAEVPVEQLPAGVGEGAVLAEGKLDEAEGRARRAAVEERRARLAESDDGADFSLEEAAP